MTHRNPCGICGHFDHFDSECFFASPVDFEGDPEMDAWLAQVAREEAELAARLNGHLAPRKRAA